jgi:hypothetical protein
MNHTLKSTLAYAGLLLSMALLAAPGLRAAEKGVATGPVGAEDFMTGALPPNGFYYLNYLTYYSSSTLKDKDGNTVPGKFSIGAVADINRFVYITNKKFLGADYGFQVILPLANVDLSVTTPGGPMSKVNTGVADVVITPLILGWHRKRFHWVGAVDVFTGAGSWDANRLVNTGKHYRSTELAFAFTYLSRGIEFSNKFMYDVNFRNGATDYLTGQQLHFDSLLGVHRGKWSFGANTYSFIQTTDDNVGRAYVGAPIVDGNRGQFFGVGPAVGYEYHHINFTVKYHHEVGVRNLFTGDRVWFKVAFPFPKEH